MRRLGFGLLALVGVLALVFVWGFLVPASPDGAWPYDLEQARKLVRALDGDRPSEVRVETIAMFEFPEAVEVTGGRFSARSMTCFAYQLVYPDGHTAIIDTAMDEQTARSGVPLKSYDAAAWARLQAALPKADFTLVTHEHFDHIGGLLVSPEGWSRAVVNQQQLEHPELVKPLHYPSTPAKMVLQYQGSTAVAPGVGLLRSPGHTPGSQLVLVQLADGRELLFLGDVAWQRDNVQQVRGRARLLTTFFENGHAVLQQLQALHTLAEKEPALAMVPGHDAAAVDALVSQGLLKRGFVVP